MNKYKEQLGRCGKNTFTANYHNIVDSKINTINVHCVSKNIPNIFSSNSSKHYPTFTSLGINITEKLS